MYMKKANALSVTMTNGRVTSRSSSTGPAGSRSQGPRPVTAISQSCRPGVGTCGPAQLPGRKSQRTADPNDGTIHFHSEAKQARQIRRGQTCSRSPETAERIAASTTRCAANPSTEVGPRTSPARMPAIQSSASSRYASLKRPNQSSPTC